MAKMKTGRKSGGPGDGKKNGSQPEPTNKGGTYMAFDNGRVLRTYGNKYTPTESIDTSGFGKGKKEFPFTTSSYAGYKVKSVKRGDVMGVISELKKGATRFEDFRSPSKRKK